MSPLPGSLPAATPAGPNPRDLVTALAHGLAVIEAFDQERARLTISEVAQRCGLSRAAARRYLITLEHLGYVSSERMLHGLTPKVLRLSQSWVHSARLPRILDAHLQALAATLREVSSVGVLDGDDVLWVAANSGGHVDAAPPQRGARVPAHCSASGRVLLATLAPPRLEAWLARQGPHTLAPLTPYTVTDPLRLRDVFEQVRRQGHASVDQELALGLRGLAVPLYNYRGEVQAALEISAPAARTTAAQLAEHCLAPLRQLQAGLRSTL